MGRRLPIALIAAVALLAGCGGSSSSEAQKPVKQIMLDAEKAADAARGVHITGWIVDSGKRVDLTFSLASASGRGTMAQGKAKAEVERVGDLAYMRANSAFWNAFANAQAAALLHDRWLSGSAKKTPFNRFATFLSLDALISSAFDNYSTLQKLGVRTYKGQQVIAIRDRKTKETLYVAATGKPYPVAALGQGRIEFTDWDKSVAVKAPKGAVDISAFGG